MNADQAMLLAAFGPLIAALAIAAAGSRPATARLGPGFAMALVYLAPVPTLVGLGLLWPAVLEGAVVESVWFAPVRHAKLGFGIEPLGMIFATLAALLWVPTTFYARAYLDGTGDRRQPQFFAFFSASIGAAICIAFSIDLFSLFVFYELLTLLTWPLVTHRGGEESRAGGRTYLALLLGTSLLLLTAIVLTYLLGGSLEFRPGGVLAGADLPPWILAVLYALFCWGIGKAALMPFHRWLPAAMVAPTPVSALLHAVAVVKAGVFSILKVSLYTFSLPLLREGGAGSFIAGVAAATLIMASITALTKSDIKERLAWSTISQLSYVVLGCALATPLALMGAVLHMVSHAVAKITLFFCAGSVYVAARTREIDDYRGLGRRLPITFISFSLAACSLVGLPPFVGMVSKIYLMRGSLDITEYAVPIILLAGSLLSALYLLSVPLSAFAGRPPDKPLDLKPLTPGCWLPPLITALCCLALVLASGWLLDFLSLLPLS